MAVLIGLEAKAYYKVGGFGGGGSWVELTNCKDLTSNAEKGEADTTTRANLGWRSTRGTLKTFSVDFQMLDDDADAAFVAFRDVFLSANDLIGMRVLDEASGEGIEGDFSVTKFSRNEPLEEAISYDVTAKLTTFSQWLERS